MTTTFMLKVDFIHPKDGIIFLLIGEHGQATVLIAEIFSDSGSLIGYSPGKGTQDLLPS